VNSQEIKALAPIDPPTIYTNGAYDVQFWLKEIAYQLARLYERYSYECERADTRRSGE
jgi:hypothetical protein